MDVFYGSTAFTGDISHLHSNERREEGEGVRYQGWRRGTSGVDSRQTRQMSSSSIPGT